MNFKKYFALVIILSSLLSCGDSGDGSGGRNDGYHSSHDKTVSSEKWMCAIDENGSGLWTINKSSNGSISVKGDFIKIYKDFGVVICPFTSGDVSIIDNKLNFTATGTAFIDLYNDYEDSSEFILSVETIFQQDLPISHYNIEFLNPDWQIDGIQLNVEGTAHPNLVDSVSSKISPRNLKTKPSGDWKPKAVFSDDNGTIEIYLQSYCTEFHNEVPDEGQLFDKIKVTDDEFLKAYSRYYNALFSICSNSNGLSILDEMRNSENDFIVNSRTLWKELALIEYQSYEIKELLFEITNEFIPQNDRNLFDQLFQRALWIKTDNIKPEDEYDENTIHDNLIDALTSITVNNSDKNKITDIVNSINKLSSEYEHKVHNIGLKLLQLINQYKDFATFSEINDNESNSDDLNTISLFKAQDDGLIEYHIEGTGDYAGDSLKLVINTLTEDVFNIEIPDALINTPENSMKFNYQNSSLLRKQNSNTPHYSKLVDNSYLYNYRIKKSGSSVQSMMSVSSINNVTLNDPNSKLVTTYSTSTYQDGDILITGSDSKGTTAKDKSTGSQFIINKLSDNEPEKKKAENIIIEQVKKLVISGGIPPLSTPGVSYASLGTGKIAIYCYGKFIDEVGLRYGINYGIFDKETGKKINDIVGNNPGIIKDSTIFNTLFWVYYVNRMTLNDIIDNLGNATYELLEQIREFLKNLEIDDSDDDSDDDSEYSPVIEVVDKCYEIDVDGNSRDVCVKYLIQDGKGVIDVSYED
ncbi:conserved hypothetical protein, secreted [Candidatus Magnetomorum sp. HK-1]|nr:conserved hypothetical protein, secreted [Candidatus Magnetomorum sp. HK-1]